jgi:hypothetical protein
MPTPSLIEGWRCPPKAWISLYVMLLGTYFLRNQGQACACWPS